MEVSPEPPTPPHPPVPGQLGSMVGVSSGGSSQNFLDELTVLLTGDVSEGRCNFSGPGGEGGGGGAVSIYSLRIDPGRFLQPDNVGLSDERSDCGRRSGPFPSLAFDASLAWPNASTPRRHKRSTRRQRRLRQDNLMASFSFIPSTAAQPRPCCSLSHTLTSSPHVSHHPPLHHPPPTADLNLVPQRLFDEAAWSFSAAALLHEPSHLCLMLGSVRPSVRPSAVSSVCRVSLRSPGFFVLRLHVHRITLLEGRCASPMQQQK